MIGKKRKKITVVGAGNVGKEIVAWCAVKELGDIVLWNRTKEKAIGIALDLSESAPIVGFDANILGTDKFSDTTNSDIIVFAAGLPRRPGMKREDLININAKIINSLVKKFSKLSPEAIIIMVTNPLDVMTFVAWKSSGFSKSKVIGQAGILDSSRFASFIAKELNVSVKRISAIVMGSHGDNMVPLPRLCKVKGKPLMSVMSTKKINSLVKHTKLAGIEIVKLLKANASYSVGAATAKIVESIVKNKKNILPCSVYLEGEYGLNNIFIGVPCKIGSKGLIKIIEYDLTKKENDLLLSASKKIKKMINKVIY